MLSSFFKTSKPIHFIITFLMVFAASTYLVLSDPLMGWSYLWIPFTAVLSVALFHFITIKNEFISSNSYGLWMYSCLFITGLLFTREMNFYIAYLFLLLSLRRVLSMHTGKQMTKKIFDASLWICIACIFYSWSIIFFSILFISIIIHAFKKLNYWAIPCIAIATVSILTFTIDQFSYLNLWSNFLDGFNYYINYDNIDFSSSLVVFLVFAMLCLVFSICLLMGIPNISLSARSRFSVLGFTGICVAIDYILNGSSLLSIIVIAIFLTRILQYSNRKILVESVLWVPFLILMVSLFLK
ncbi:hypothetical protein [Nonlabens dokdonensis]|nr:hypothetical protein [Nonlabens dokdonensis]